METYVNEKNEEVKDQIIGAVSAVVWSTDQNVRNEFLEKLEGLKWIRGVLLSSERTKQVQKSLTMLYDFVVNGDKAIQTQIWSHNDVINKLESELNFDIQV